MLRWAGAKIGENVRVYSRAHIIGTGALVIGDDVHIGGKCFISPIAPASITIGSHVDIGPEVMLITGSHEIDPAGEHIGGKGTTAPISIGSGSWLGARAKDHVALALEQEATMHPIWELTLIARANTHMRHFCVAEMLFSLRDMRSSCLCLLREVIVA